MPPFPGFSVPRQNWFKMPSDWTNLTAHMSSLAELKVVEYVLKHTWGYREYGLHKLISTDEFMHGRRRKDGSRIDLGTGLSKPSVIAGIKSAVADGFLEELVDDRDRGRVKKYYALHMIDGYDFDVDYAVVLGDDGGDDDGDDFDDDGDNGDAGIRDGIRDDDGGVRRWVGAARGFARGDSRAGSPGAAPARESPRGGGGRSAPRGQTPGSARAAQTAGTAVPAPAARGVKDPTPDVKNLYPPVKNFDIDVKMLDINCQNYSNNNRPSLPATVAATTAMLLLLLPTSKHAGSPRAWRSGWRALTRAPTSRRRRPISRFCWMRGPTRSRSRRRGSAKPSRTILRPQTALIGPRGQISTPHPKTCEFGPI
jgi:hypothetical protein